MLSRVKNGWQGVRKGPGLDWMAGYRTAVLAPENNQCQTNRKVTVGVSTSEKRMTTKRMQSFLQAQPEQQAMNFYHGRRPFTTSANCKSSSVERNPLPAKVLIANRGEIACRVIKTCARLGIKTVAVYSEADAKAAHVALADEAYCIGAAPSAESYLKMDRIIEVCKRSGAEMVHPGYGFLSENAEFATRLSSAGITFIGPPAEAIVSMGSKSASKEIMSRAGVPCVPGYHGSNQSDEVLQREAEKIGYPILIKAVKGGGGKGMKIVESADDFLEQLESARREALTSFGDGDVLIERYLTKPRHVEVQIVSSGNPHNEHVAISTRDCSVQRRHQKIIEEAPAPHLPDEVEKDLCLKAVAATRAVGYQGAGTVEFILDADTNEAWFLECNTRLQVEHPVSEMVSGIDLVEWQLESAAGNSLPLDQSQIQRNGHAFEARIYAEDTNANFLPDVGHLSYVDFPAPTTALLSPATVDSDSAIASIRVDTGVRTGDDVSVFYDPMIAKIIVHGRDRREALRLMRRALEQTHIVGPKTNVKFLSNLCRHEAFIDGSALETGFIKKYKDQLIPEQNPQEPLPLKTAVHAAVFMSLLRVTYNNAQHRSPDNIWSANEFGSFRQSVAQSPSSKHFLRRRALKKQDSEDEANSPITIVTVTPISSVEGRVSVAVDGVKSGDFDMSMSKNGIDLLLRPVLDANATLDASHIPVGTTSAKIIATPPALSGPVSTELRLDIFENTHHTEVDVVAPKWFGEVHGGKTKSKGSMIAPMPSKVVEVRVKSGQQVNEGDIVVVLEAMKTEHTLRAPRSGTVKKVTVESGNMCAEGTELVQFEEAESDD